MRCPACGTDNERGRKFCVQCGQPLQARCPSCGASVEAGHRFCGECGAALAAPAGEAPPPVAERRVCSVLFADLVGFTPFSETRDAEAVRELLSGYFDLARTMITRYGGTVEKFIGDAVMAVWGVPTAHEDDAERSVRAALELVDAVAAYGEGTGAPTLRARAGVVTGEVAATLGAAGEGLVAGDAVNTAARVQAAAEPGAVLVDEPTRRVTGRAIGYADTGLHPLKGKSEPVRLFRATRVVGTVGGSERVDGLEAAFLGRDRELRLVKEAFHECSRDRQARLVSVVGIPGVGKSRLRWEFSKYIDGLAEPVFWHAGRCLSYGEGVAYWALGEMLRQRFGIAEDEPVESAARKLDDGLRRWVDSEADRAFLPPRLGVLLGTAASGLSRQELFAGWRLFFEHLAEREPVLLVIEDLQWADSGLLDFLEHLLEWSANYPLFLLTFARPDLADRRPTWGTLRSNSSSLVLGPLPEPAMRELLDGLVPGLPADIADRIVAQADGIPLYAVEMVRSLVDRDAVQPLEGVYRLVGEVTSLDVPASLASLIASRIDALAAEERALVQSLAVLGMSFPRTAMPAVSQLPDDELDRLLADLVRKEILAVRTDRLSPERGQYTFAQALLRQVAYDTLSRRERKARHLAVAAHLRASFPDDGAEVAEVIARHYQDALAAVPDAPDAVEIRAEAVSAFARAGTRALAIGAPDAAEDAYATAARLTADESRRLEFVEAAGESAFVAGRPDAALARFEEALSGHAAAGREREAARVTGRVASALGVLGRGEQAIPRLRDALTVLAADDPDATVAQLHTALTTNLLFSGHRDEAFESADAALALAQALELPGLLVDAAERRATLLAYTDRPREGLAYWEWAIGLAARHGFTDLQTRAEGNAGSVCADNDLPLALEHCQAALELARRRGDRGFQLIAADNLARVWLFAGRWADVADLCEELAGASQAVSPEAGGLAYWIALSVWRGELGAAQSYLTSTHPDWQGSDDVQWRSLYGAFSALIANATGDHAAALDAAAQACRDAIDTIGVAFEGTRLAFPEGLEAALALGRLDEADKLVALLADRPVGHVPPYLRAQLARYRARVAAAQGGRDEDVAADFRRAADILRELDYPYFRALVELDHATWLVGLGRAGEATELLDAAVATFDHLGAAPALGRARRLWEQVPQLA